MCIVVITLVTFEYQLKRFLLVNSIIYLYIINILCDNFNDVIMKVVWHPPSLQK